MICDRTEEDVLEALRIIKEKVMRFQELTDDEKNILERGTMNINTINRIFQKQEELKESFEEMGYYNAGILKKEYGYDEIFRDSDFLDMLNNIKILSEAFYVFLETPSVPKPLYHFSNLNDAEKILSDLEEMTGEIREKYKRSGTFFCGEEG